MKNKFINFIGIFIISFCLSSCDFANRSSYNPNFSSENNIEIATNENEIYVECGFSYKLDIYATKGNLSDADLIFDYDKDREIYIDESTYTIYADLHVPRIDEVFEINISGNNVSNTITINAHFYSTNIEITNNKGLSLEVGETHQIDYRLYSDEKIHGNSNFNGEVFYRVYDNSIVSIDQNGIITALKPGRTILDVVYKTNSLLEYEESRDAINIVVHPKEFLYSYDNDDEVYMFTGETYEYRFPIYDEDSPAIFTTSDDEIVSIIDVNQSHHIGTYKALKEGEVTISCSVSNYKGTLKIKIYDVNRFNFEVGSNFVTLSGVNDLSGIDRLTIPSTYHNLPITTIGENCFLSKHNIDEVNLIGTNVRHLKPYAFFNTNIKNLLLPRNIEIEDYGLYSNVGTFAFIEKGIDNIESIDYRHNNDVYATYYGFNNYRGQKDGNYYYLTNIDDEVFITIYGYQGYSIDYVVPSSFDIDNKTYEVKRLITLMSFNNDLVGRITIPGTVTTIESIPWYVTEVILNEGTTRIASGAFSYNIYLTELIIPRSIIDISYEAFEDSEITKLFYLADDKTAPHLNDPQIDEFYNYSLKNGTLNNGFDYVICHDEENKDYVVLINFNSDEYEGDYKKQIVIPSQVTINGLTYDVKEVGPNCFKKLRYSECVIISEGVEIIGVDAFATLDLKKLYTPKSLRLVKRKAFSWSNIEELYFSSLNLTFEDTSVTNAFRGNLIFEGNENPVNYNVETSDYALSRFGLLFGFKKFVYDDLGIKYALLEDEYNNKSLVLFDGKEINKETITIPSSLLIDGEEVIVNRISASAFKKNNYVKTVIYPTTIKQIDYAAFEDCSNMESIECTSKPNLYLIGTCAFLGCKSLKTFYIPESTQFVGVGVFYNDDNISIFIESKQPGPYWELGEYYIEYTWDMGLEDSQITWSYSYDDYINNLNNYKYKL